MPPSWTAVSCGWRKVCGALGSSSGFILNNDEGTARTLHNSEGPELVVFTPALFIRPLARRGGLGGRNLDKLSSLLPAIVTDAVQVLKHFRLPHKYNRSAHIEAYSLTIYVIKPFAVNSPQSPWWYQRDLLWRAITMGNMSGWSKT